MSDTSPPEHVRAICFLLMAIGTAPAFSQQRSASTPGPRMGHSLVYDEANRRMLLLDGYSWIRAISPAQPPDRTEMWAWNGRVWRRLNGVGPSSRALGRAVYDASRRAVVSYGGRVGREEAATSETWEWRDDLWTRSASATAGPNVHIEMAYDAARHQTIRFGGALREAPGLFSWPTETWGWTGTRWRTIAADGPPGRTASAMTYDSHRRQVVLFGGQGAAGADGEQVLFGDTWTWNGQSWRLASTSGPPARAFHAMTFDQRAGVVLLHGGASRSDLFNDLWAWDGAGWRSIAPIGPAPSKRRLHALAYDKDRQRTVMYGGVGPDASGRTIGFSDTWEWDGRAWTAIADGAQLVHPNQLEPSARPNSLHANPLTAGNQRPAA